MKTNLLTLFTAVVAAVGLVACDPEPDGLGDGVVDNARQDPVGEMPPITPSGPTPMAPDAAPMSPGDDAPAPPDDPPAQPQDPPAQPQDPPQDPSPADPPEAPSPTPVANGDCPVDAFLNVANVAGAGDNYPMPSIEVTCTDDTINIQSNGIPHYAFQAVTPNALRAQNHNWTIPRRPVYVEEMTDIPLLGLAAISINGLSIYGPNEGAMPHPYGDPVYNDIMDWCLGHTGPVGDYHYHALLEACFFEGLSTERPSPILGFALDGFPIYGPRGCLDADCAEMVTFESSWTQVGDPTTYAWDNYACDQASCDAAVGARLDRCNGRVGPDGSYRYHATDSFPYIIGCYHGDVSGAANIGGGGPGGGQGPGGQGDAPEGDQPPAGPGGGPDGGPPSCEAEADCDDACPPEALGCTCADSPRGSICVPVCDQDADCEGLAPVDLFCGNRGFCVPAR